MFFASPRHSFVLSTILLLGLSGAGAPPAHAKDGIGAGGGGKGVYCPMPDGGKKLFVLDYDRARHEWGVPLKLPAQGDEYARATAIVRRLGALDPLRAAKYELAVAEFASQVNWIEKFDLGVTDDSGELGICTGGQIGQIIVQSRRDKPWNRDKTYVVHQERWNELDVDQRAGLIVHEVILGEGLKSGWTASDGAMWLNVLLSSDRLAGYDYRRYADLIVELKLERPSPIALLKHVIAIPAPDAAILDSLAVGMREGAWQDAPKLLLLVATGGIRDEKILAALADLIIAPKHTKSGTEFSGSPLLARLIRAGQFIRTPHDETKVRFLLSRDLAASAVTAKGGKWCMMCERDGVVVTFSGEEFQVQRQYEAKNRITKQEWSLLVAGLRDDERLAFDLSPASVLPVGTDDDGALTWIRDRKEFVVSAVERVCREGDAWVPVLASAKP